MERKEKGQIHSNFCTPPQAADRTANGQVSPRGVLRNSQESIASSSWMQRNLQWGSPKDTLLSPLLLSRTLCVPNDTPEQLPTAAIFPLSPFTAKIQTFQAHPSSPTADNQGFVARGTLVTLIWLCSSSRATFSFMQYINGSNGHDNSYTQRHQATYSW